MFKSFFTTVLAILSIAIFAQDSNTSYEMHGQTIDDPYLWLEDKEDEKVKEWTNDQHQATLDYVEALSDVPGLKDDIRNYIDRDQLSSVFVIGERQFFYLKKQGEAQRKLYTRIGEEDICIFDPTQFDSTGFSSISGNSFSKDGNRAAIGMQYKGAEISTYRIIDTKTGEVEGEPIEGLRGFGFTKDEQHAYIRVGTKEMLEQQIPIKTYLHTIGADRSTDEFLFAPEDPKDFVSIWDARYADVTFKSKGDFYSNTLFIRRNGMDEDFQEVYSSQENRAGMFALKDELYIRTNHDAPNFKLMKASLAKPGFENWKELIPNQDDMVMENYVVTPDHIIVQGKKDVINRLFVYDHEGNYQREIELPEVANVGRVSYHRESNTMYVSLNTFTSPTKVYRLNGETFEWTLHFEQPPPIATDDIESKIEWYESKDGTKVPIFIMYKKGTVLDGNNPTWLWGYGGFNIGMSPNYIGMKAAFVNRGGVYAIAGLRGGDEYGEDWHKDGMMYNKQNVFDDFISAAEYLIEENYTNPEKLAVDGRSNGGLLIGATITQRPELFKAAICGVPLLDMVRFHKFLIARYWIPEYGDPDKKEDFDYIMTYSPYHNIPTDKTLPTTYVFAGENDTRVDPLHAKKFVAAVQNNQAQKNPFLLYMDFDSGHGSGKSTEQQIFYWYAQYKFMMNELGMVGEEMKSELRD